MEDLHVSRAHAHVACFEQRFAVNGGEEASGRKQAVVTPPLTDS